MFEITKTDVYYVLAEKYGSENYADISANSGLKKADFQVDRLLSVVHNN